MKEFYFIDDLDVAQDLTDDAVIELARKHGKDIVNHIFIEVFSKVSGIEYLSISEAIKKQRSDS